MCVRMMGGTFGSFDEIMPSIDLSLKISSDFCKSVFNEIDTRGHIEWDK